MNRKNVRFKGFMRKKEEAKQFSMRIASVY